MTMRGRFLVALFLLMPSLLLRPLPAHAALPEEFAPPAGSCDQVHRLAGIVAAEASDAQPLRARLAIAQIVAREAASRGMDVCALSERTNFVSVWHYAQARPDSWTARQISDPPAWALSLAREVLSNDWPDATGGANHFDGVETPRDMMVIGTVHFQP